MNLFKRITAVLIVFSLACAFGSCGKADKETNSTTVQSETQISDIAQDGIKTEYLAATEADFEILNETVRGIWLSSARFDENGVFLHNKDSETALDDAMHMIFNDGVKFVWFLEDLYNIKTESESFSFYDNDGEPVEAPADPLGMFYSGMPGAFGYIKYKAEQIDWVLENVFSVEPDENYINEHMGRYYYDGYYYFRFDEGGGGGHRPTILDYEVQTDGSYIVTFSTHEEGYEFETEYSILEAKAALREVDGKRVWQVSYLKVTEVVQVEES